MTTLEAPEWLPSFAIPFLTLSYPTEPPAAPDSFPNSKYYSTGLLDVCIVITIIIPLSFAIAPVPILVTIVVPSV